MTSEEYQSLDELLQAQLLWIDGVFLMMRKTERVNVELYSIYNFYTEVFFDKKNNEPLYIKAFELGKNMDAYLEMIDIDDIFERIK